VILVSEVDLAARRVIDRMEQRNGTQAPPEVLRNVYADTLQGLIDNMLIESFARRANLKASDGEIDHAIESIAGEEGVTTDAVYTAAEQQGLSKAAYRDELGKQITRMKVISGSVRSRVSVSDGEVKELYEERYSGQEPGLRVRARHILLPWIEGMPEEEKQKTRDAAEQIRERAIETGDFASLAAQYSRAPSAAEGGLTTFREGEVSPEIATQVFGLPPGEISDVIETEHGLNIFQIVNRYDPAEISYGDVEESLRAELIERKTMPEFDEWMQELRKNRYIEIVETDFK
jgi:peptidyl-prolyl cis-trans isomerase SurA